MPIWVPRSPNVTRCRSWMTLYYHHFLWFTHTCLLGFEKYSTRFSRLSTEILKYQSTEKRPNQALYIFSYLDVWTKAHFCRCTFLFILILTDLYNKRVIHFTSIFCLHISRPAFILKEWDQHISVVWRSYLISYWFNDIKKQIK